jgi:lysozyme
MVDDIPPAGNGKKAGGIAALILTASLALYPFTSAREGVKYKAYLDPVGIPTICQGIIKGVKLGDVATKEQCEQYYLSAMQEKMRDVIKITPALAENQNALEAAGDLAYNGGSGAYVGSPASRYFSKRDWVAGCKSITGWWVIGTYPQPQPEYTCTKKKSGKGWACILPGLVSRRVGETKLCLGQTKASFDLK